MKPFALKLLSIVLISCLGTAVYSNTFHCPFQLDDITSIVFNFAIRNIHHLQQIGHYLPRRFILYLSIAFNYHFSGLHVQGYHLFNLAVHLLSAILVWWLTLLTLSTPAMKEEKIARHADLIALFAGLIFVAHPIQTEAVTYIVQRAASIAALFYLASLCLYVKSVKEIASSPTAPRKDILSKVYYTGALVTAVVAMFTKETAITLPLMIVLYEYCFLRTKGSVNWRYLSPFLLTLFIIPLTMLFTETTPARLEYLHNEPGISPLDYLLTQFRVLLTYVRLVFIPAHQNIDYDYSISKSILEWPVLLSFLSIIIILIWAKRLFLKYRIVSFSIFWFFLTLLPESSFLPIHDVIFEHRLYLPMVGYSIFLTSGVYYGMRSFASLRITIVVLTLIIGCYAILTYQRNKVWQDGLTLWSDTIQKSPHKARPYYSRGLRYADQGDFNKAIVDYNKAIELDPKYAQAYYARGVGFAKLNDFTQAMSDFTTAIEADPYYADAYNNRGIIYATQGNITQAISDFDKAITANPIDAQSYVNLGHAYLLENRYDKALENMNKAKELRASVL